jgi:hypothetical protein
LDRRRVLRLANLKSLYTLDVALDKVLSAANFSWVAKLSIIDYELKYIIRACRARVTKMTFLSGISGDGSYTAPSLALREKDFIATLLALSCAVTCVGTGA